MFGNRIKELRTQRGYSTNVMASFLGISERKYKRSEAVDIPDGATLVLCADFFGVTTDYLLGRSDIKSTIEVQSSDSVNLFLIDELKQAKQRIEFLSAENFLLDSHHKQISEAYDYLWKTGNPSDFTWDDNYDDEI